MGGEPVWKRGGDAQVVSRTDARSESVTPKTHCKEK